MLLKKFYCLTHVKAAKLGFIRYHDRHIGPLSGFGRSKDKYNTQDTSGPLMGETQERLEKDLSE